MGTARGVCTGALSGECRELSSVSKPESTRSPKRPLSRTIGDEALRSRSAYQAMNYGNNRDDKRVSPGQPPFSIQITCCSAE